MKKKTYNSREQKTEKFQPLSANVKVIGVGGGGSNAVSRMAKDFVRGVDFIAINTDHQDLDHCNVKRKLYIGKSLTRGLGTGMNPDLGRQAAEENRSEIAEAVQGADLVFISAGLGGGTGSGATPIVAEAAKQSGALTIAVVTKPFSFEGTQRERIATEALMKLKDKVDAIIVVPNDRIFTVISKDTPIMKAFEAIDDVLRQALRGLVEIIAMPGIINVDFADVKNIMEDAGVAIVGTGTATGPERAVNAVNTALHSPLLETSPDGAKAVLLGISGSRDLKMTEINEAAKVVAQIADPSARIIFGAYYDRNLKPGQVKVTVVATGFNTNQASPLFGNQFERQPMMFPRTSPNNDLSSASSGSSGNMAKKYPFKEFEESSRVATGSSNTSLHKEKEESSEAKELPSYTPKYNPAINKRERDQKVMEKESKDGKESDPWDIPAFLRRRKK